ncbi:MAG: deoxyribonuclease V [Elusimicrobiota bacterium]|nr:deoxyribonuclease V [Elusimicrobiota bacterium]
MIIKNKFEMPTDVRQAKIIQQNLSAKIILKNDFEDILQIKTIAGCDVSYSKDEENIFAAIVVLDFASLEIVEKIKIRYRKKFAFPYIPGYLSFREGPVLLEAIKKLKTKPNVFLFDGQGIAHPRGIGIASHLGVILDKPSIGCAKSHLYGNYEEPPPALKGAYTFLKDAAGTLIGLIMRSKKFTKPIFISQGHRIGLTTAADIVFKCLTKYRIPEPLRLAHIEANKG